jgi:hypothetical protein
MQEKTINKLQRKIDLDRLVPEWNELYNKARSPFEWNSLLLKFDDRKVKALCGTDAALYLVFLRQSSVFFTTIATINIFFIIIFYLGEPTPLDDYRL